MAYLGLVPSERSAARALSPADGSGQTPDPGHDSDRFAARERKRDAAIGISPAGWEGLALGLTSRLSRRHAQQCSPRPDSPVLFCGVETELVGATTS